MGWDSLAIDVDDRFIFKFPRHEQAKRALRMEAALLALIGDRVSMSVPRPGLEPGPPLFSFHEKIPGEHLLARDYARLEEGAKESLARAMGRFYAELHDLPVELMEGAGAGPIEAWMEADAILDGAMPLLPASQREKVQQAMARWAGLGEDPHGDIYGFFDGHGWNMAFDHRRGRLNGLYDFADSGIGPLQQDFIYSNWISRDLTERIILHYEALTGRRIDRERVALQTAALRLTELACNGRDPVLGPQMLSHVVQWFDDQR
ncbi:aminoglycoside phosphotransferase family protein [Arsenicitalea aurantiaca]|uniref:Aminoglycoside phosphotransferase family protein n=1 Tax=Arsenicitalea aurantiaca TaxID=1783274 RepID=A0A433XLZ6_9HYPH|nr:aminoglycoside phosphotransferase family protein [Arsenicitalea aurantiaca]RUT35008.1 aminoglycoside phosphotransferase family protein [Arsenicitalea aurantiaca]